MRRVKCFVGNWNGNLQGLVCATSKKAAAKVARTSLHDFNQYWHSALSVAISQFKPDTLYVRPFNSNEPWREKDTK